MIISRRLGSQIEMILISLSVSIFTLGYTYFSIFICFFILFTSKNIIKLPLFILTFITLLLMSGTLLSLLNIVIDRYDDIYTTSVLLRIRFFWIRILFASAILVYLMKLEYEQVLKFVYYISIPHLIAAIIQVFFLKTTRVSMLTSEPSAAAMYYIFLMPLLIEYAKINRKTRLLVSLFIVIGLLIRSKAQILVIPFFILYFVFKSDNKKLKRIVTYILLVSIFLTPLILNIEQVDEIVYFLDILREKGIGGLTARNKIWSTFTLRFSSFLTSIQLFFDNIFGIGFGGFHPMYIEKMTSGSIQSKMTGTEIASTLKNELYATPKSIFFEYFVNCGVFFLIPLFNIIRKFYKSSISLFVKASFYGLLFLSLMVELSPFLTFVIISAVLYYKSKNQTQVI